MSQAGVTEEARCPLWGSHHLVWPPLSLSPTSGLALELSPLGGGGFFPEALAHSGHCLARSSST